MASGPNTGKDVAAVAEMAEGGALASQFVKVSGCEVGNWSVAFFGGSDGQAGGFALGAALKLIGVGRGRGLVGVVGAFHFPFAGGRVFVLDAVLVPPGRLE